MPGIRRIVADNPSLMTYHGTNTYLIDSEGGIVVLDPGPDQNGHVDDIMSVVNGNVCAILISHSHSDHIGAAAALKAATGAKTFAFHLSADPQFKADVQLHNGDQFAGMTVIHTPGHASDHLCFARPDGVVFTADHIMSWSSSIVSPPNGSMAAYCDSLRIMLSRSDNLYLPGHGPPLPLPQSYVADLLGRRIQREHEIYEAIISKAATTWELMDRLYSKTDPYLRQAAERNVVAHLEKLLSEGRVKQVGETWRALPNSYASVRA